MKDQDHTKLPTGRDIPFLISGILGIGASGPIIAKSQMPVPTMIFWRNIIGGLVMLPFALARGEWKSKEQRRAIRWSAFLIRWSSLSLWPAGSVDAPLAGSASRPLPGTSLSVVNRLIRPVGLSPTWLPASPAHSMNKDHFSLLLMGLLQMLAWALRELEKISKCLECNKKSTTHQPAPDTRWASIKPRYPPRNVWLSRPSIRFKIAEIYKV